MNISFQKKKGNSSLGIAFFWQLEVTAKSPAVVTDHFIPELFFDYFFVKRGKVAVLNASNKAKTTLPQQSLKTIHTRPLTFEFTLPLVLFGARMSLQFAESFWEEANANTIQVQGWVGKDAKTLNGFASQITDHLQSNQRRRIPYPMLAGSLNESNWLVHFSPRHKRRLYKSTFGLSRKELQNINNVHAFLEQACDFGSQHPRIIRHVNPEVFYDQPHLNRMFRKMTGFSPIQYFEANSILQDNLMSASYNEKSVF